MNTSLRALARQRTAAAHTALEATALMRTMSSGSPTDSQYGDYLARQYRLHSRLEAALCSWVPPAWRKSRLVKSQWIRSDLQVLGQALPRGDIECPSINSQAEALGTLYVLEGSTLGLQIVRRRIHKLHPTFIGADRFLRAYGGDTGLHWRLFVEQLEALPPETWAQALEAACGTFSVFHREFMA